MPLPFLQQFVQDFSPAQRRALEDLAGRAAAGNAIGEDEILALIAKVEAGVKPLFEAPIFEEEILDGCKISTALEALRADITALMVQAQTVEAVGVKHEQLHRSLIKKYHQAILRLDEMLLINKSRRENAGFTDIKILDFYNAQNEASSANRASVEPDTGQLVGGSKTLIRYLTRGGDLQPKLVSTLISSGVNPDSGKSFLPDESIRLSDNYVWAEVLLADGELSGTYDSVDYTGAVVALDVFLPQAEDVNEIKLAPFGRYPLQLISAQYYDGEDLVAVPDITVPLTLELDVTPLRFTTINTQRLRLVFHQPEYRFAEHVFERGQIKRASFMNVMLERALEDTINNQGTLPFELLDSRRATAKAALDQRLSGISKTQPLDRYQEAIKEIVDVGNTQLIRVTKNEYVVGLRQLEVNYRRYFDTSEYSSQPLQATGSVFQFALETDETHVQVSDGVAAANITAVEYEVDLGGGRIIPIVPEGTTRIESERLDFDATLAASTRFTTDGTPNAIVRRDGLRLTVTTDYTISTPASDVATVTILADAWRPGAAYTISYDIEAGQDLIDVLTLYDSIKPIRPELFGRTGDGNRVSLKAHPFVLTEITQDKYRWSQPDPFDATWVYRGPVEARNAIADPAYIIEVDREWFGASPTTLALSIDINSSVTSFDIEITDTIAGAFPDKGIIQITSTVSGQTEQIYYDGIVAGFPGTAMTIQNCIRGFNNTTAMAHTAASSTVKYIVSEFYSPVIAKFNGQHCRNLTNYATGRNPAFVDTSGPPQFVQIGTSLYFDRPLAGEIEVWYRRLVDALTIRAKLRTHHPSKEFTPSINRFTLKMRTATL